jgi:hypothetical protein
MLEGQKSEFLSNSDLAKDTDNKEAKSEGHVTVLPKIPVYSDLSVDSIKERKIGSSGFEPLTPTVSKDEPEKH